MAEEKKEVKENEVTNETKKPDPKVKVEIEKTHKKLTADTKQAYSSKNITNEKEIVKEIRFAGSKIKFKKILQTTYENGVIKNKLVGVTKA